MVVIYKGEDTQFADLRKIVFTLQADGISLTGWMGRFHFMGSDKCIETAAVASKSFTVEYTTDETREFPLGMNYGTLHLYDAEGRHAQTAKVQIDVRLNPTICGVATSNQIKVNANNVFVDYNQCANKATINGVTVEGAKTSADYGILSVEGLTAEIARATAAEAALGTRITNETARATGAETSLGNRIMAETNRATAAENALSGRVGAIEAKEATWDGKQDSISDLETIRYNASAGKSASETIATYGNIVTHSTSEFATAAQGAKADTAMQHSEFSSLASDADLVPDETGITELCTMLNKIKNLLKPATACVAISLALAFLAHPSAQASANANGTEVKTGKLSSLVGKTLIVTNVTGLADLATYNDATNAAHKVVTNLVDVGYLASSNALSNAVARLEKAIGEATPGDYENVSNKAYTALQPEDVVNDVTSSETKLPLSANMGKELQDQITNLKQRGRYLSIWNCTNGLAETVPTVHPYTYKSGDYFIVGIVSTGLEPNYRPVGATYSTNTPSRTVETAAVLVNDTYYYDGTTWSLLQAAQKEVTFGSIVGSPYDNTSLSNALSGAYGYTTGVSNKVEDIKSDYTTHQSATNAANAAITNAVENGYLARANFVVVTNEQGVAEIKIVRVNSWWDLQLGYGWGGSGQTLYEFVESDDVTNAGAVAEAKAYADDNFLTTNGGSGKTIQWLDDPSGLSINATVFGDTWVGGIYAIGDSNPIQKDNNDVVYGVSTNGTEYLHANVDLAPWGENLLSLSRADNVSILCQTNVSDFASYEPNSIVDKVLHGGTDGQAVSNIVNNFVSTNTTMFVTNSALTIAQGGSIKWQESFGGYKMANAAAMAVTPADHGTTFVTLLAGTNTLAITAPVANANGEARDFVMAVSATDATTMSFNGFTGMFAADASATNALAEGKTTMLYFTEIKANEWFIGRQEAVNVTP